MSSIYLLPSNPINFLNVDSEFEKVAHSIKESSDEEFLTFDYDSFIRYGKVKIFNPYEYSGPVIYTGWMMTVTEYQSFFDALAETGLDLITSPEQYKKAHYIDGWVEKFNDVTFPTVLIDSDATEDVVVAAGESLGSEFFIIKDYVKSFKFHGLNKPVALSSLYSHIEVLKSLDDWVISGGLAVRAYEELPTERVEIRGFWKDGQWLTFVKHPDFDSFEGALPVVSDDVLYKVSQNLTDLNFRYVSVDFVLTESGAWRVIEVGDGQVSGVPESISAVDLEKIFGA